MLKKIPNILTIGRIIIVPFFVLAFYLPGFYGDLTALILFIIASFTDFLDGMLARMLGQESKLGELLDPIADKIIVATALILLVMDGTIRNYEVIAAIKRNVIKGTDFRSNVSLGAKAEMIELTDLEKKIAIKKVNQSVVILVLTVIFFT